MNCEDGNKSSGELLFEALLNIDRSEVEDGCVQDDLFLLSGEKKILALIHTRALYASLSDTELYLRAMERIASDMVYDEGRVWLDRGRKVQVWPPRES